jgi:hypothetical protein
MVLAASARDLLGLDVQGPAPFETGQVLKLEFELIHGRNAWNPGKLDPDRVRKQLRGEGSADNGQVGKQTAGEKNKTEKFSQTGSSACQEQAETEPLKEENESDRLALYAWSVRNLPKAGQAALCLSGGGIRSAAFGLGILQGLARRGLLDKFHYLSTVSGGGYIASWLSAWRHRHGMKLVLDGLSPRKFDELEEPEPMGRLRFNQNFLTPRVGLASADTWTAFGAVLRNLLLNWLVFLPLLAGLLLVPRIVQAFFVWVQQQNGPYYPYPSLKSLFGPWLPHDAEQIVPITGLGGWAGWRSWADSVAVVLIVLGFSVSAYNRPANGGTSLTQAGYLKRVVFPVLAGAVLLAAAIASWADKMTGSSSERVRWMLLGGMVYVLARLIAAACAYSRFRKAPHKWAFPLELIGWAVAGMCTGLLVVLGAELCRSFVIPNGDLSTVISKDDLAKYLAIFGPPWITGCFLFGEVIYTGVTSRLPYGERDREWLARAGGWFGIFAVPYLAFSGLVLFGWPEVQEARLQTSYLIAVGGSGLLSIFGALTPLTRPVAMASKEKFPITRIVTVLSGLFILIASAGLSDVVLDFLFRFSDVVHTTLGIGPNDCFSKIAENIPLRHCSRDQSFPPDVELTFIVCTSIILLSISGIISFFINVNFFSLHALYRNRLVKTFLGASNVKPKPEDEERNAFDGFSERDNLAMAQLYENMNIGQVKLYPVLNMSLNLLATQNLAWQERKAESFVSTPFFTGSHKVGYRLSALYSAGWWGSLGEPERGISLGTAMAISGAAVSPNWGYHSSPITSFLMMLANVRLGAWLGNPKHKAAWRYSGPRFSWRLFLQEALGRTDDKEPWIYLSDGGHFENLGLYEMVRRRCRTIVISDAGADPKCTLEDLGNAVRKIAIDFGVKIEFRRIHVRKRSDVSMAGVYCALGDIHYPEGVCGRIIYFKPGFYGKEEPADVRAYAAANAKFPHESTVHQWFGESQFESYRSLGAHVIAKICDRNEKDDIDCGLVNDRLSLEEFVDRTKEYLKEFENNNVSEGATLVEIRRSITVAAAE